MLLMLKSKTTKRKFYNKWLYKITIRIPQVQKRVHDISGFGYSHYVHSQVMLQELTLFLDSHGKDSWAKRIESSNIDIYVNDKVVFDELAKQYEDKIVHKFEPDENLDMLLDGNYTVVKKLPHGRFRYKVFLLPHVLKRDSEQKHNVLNWIESQRPKINISDSVKEWFIRTNWNWDRRYIYVEDEGTLLMMRLRLGEAVGKVHEYRINDK